MEQKDLSGRVAIVTGGASGIGFEIARVLCEHGAIGVVVDYDEKSLKQSAENLRGEGFDILPIRCDISRADEVSAMVEQVVARYGKIDILVNNAGVIDDTPWQSVTPEGWDRVLDINLKGSQLCTLACVKHMIKANYGRLVFISSRAGQMGSELVPPTYSASKAGMISLAKSYARYTAEFNIVSNAIAPAFIDTKMNRFPGSPESLIMKRFGTPREVANVAYFLASDLCSYVTGVTVEANGGNYMR